MTSTSKLPTDPNREPWTWQHMIIAFLMVTMLAFIVYTALYMLMGMIEMTVNAVSSLAFR